MYQPVTVTNSSFYNYTHSTLLAEAFVSNERLCGNRVNFLLSMRKVLLWPRHHFDADFQSRFCTRAPHASWTISWYFYENGFLFQAPRNLRFSRIHIGLFFYCLVFLFSSRERFCKNARNFANMTRTTKVTRVPQVRALFDNSSVLTYGLPVQCTK